jgi:exodeoxyribonuclease VII small subunit
MADRKQDNNIEKMNFEQAIRELTEIVGKIEQGQIPLQESIEQYEKGMTLIKHCREILQKAEKRIEKISDSGNKKMQDSQVQSQKEDTEAGEDGNLPF